MTRGKDIRPGTPRADSDEKLPRCCRAWIVEQTRRQEATAPARLLEGTQRPVAPSPTRVTSSDTRPSRRGALASE